jgi:hypothetical protein
MLFKEVGALQLYLTSIMLNAPLVTYACTMCALLDNTVVFILLKNKLHVLHPFLWIQRDGVHA